MLFQTILTLGSAAIATAAPVVTMTKSGCPKGQTMVNDGLISSCVPDSSIAYASKEKRESPCPSGYFVIPSEKYGNTCLPSGWTTKRSDAECAEGETQVRTIKGDAVCVSIPSKQELDPPLSTRQFDGATYSNLGCPKGYVMMNGDMISMCVPQSSVSA